MTTQTTRIKNGTITLPPQIRKYWKGAEVFIAASNDIISIKRLAKPLLTLREMMDEFSMAARKTKLSKNEAMGTLRKVRQGVYK